jgi:TolA-binding protein
MNAVILIELQLVNVSTVIDKLIIDFSGHPDLPRALWYVAEKYVELQEYKKANNIYEQIVQRYPGDLDAVKKHLDFQKTHILFLIESGQGVDAKAAIDRLSTDFLGYPGQLSTLDYIAGKYQFLEKYDDAIEVYRKMTKIDPQSELAAMAQQSIGWTYFARGMYDQAIEEYRKVLEDYPESVRLPSVQYWIAQSYNKKREYEQAKEEYQKVVSIYPESRCAIYSEQAIARIYSKLNMHEQAISERRKIVNKYPDSGWAPSEQRGVARSYYNKGDLEQAIKEYQKVIEMYPASKAAATAEKRIAQLKSMKKN